MSVLNLYSDFLSSSTCLMGNISAKNLFSQLPVRSSNQPQLLVSRGPSAARLIAAHTHTHIRGPRLWPRSPLNGSFTSRHTVLPFSDRLSLQADLRAIWMWHSVSRAPRANGLGLGFKISHPEEGERRRRGEEQVAPHLPSSLLTYSKEQGRLRERVGGGS